MNPITTTIKIKYQKNHFSLINPIYLLNLLFFMFNFFYFLPYFLVHFNQILMIKIIMF